MAAGQFILTWQGDESDNDILSFNIKHLEGDFATMTIETRNPHVGVLAEGRSLFATLSWDSGAGVIDLFSGLLVGIPKKFDREVIELEFVARSDDFLDQKAALAETLKVRPFYDPIFVDPQKLDEVDHVLEARPQLWHIDRVTGLVTVSDIIQGEDGTLDLGDQIFDDSLDISYTSPPASAVHCKCDLSWKQAGKGSVDLSSAIVDAFSEGGSLLDGYISTYTGGGLMTSWPKTGHSIGGGWKVGLSYCQRAENFETNWVQIRTTTGGFDTNVDQGANAIQYKTDLKDDSFDPLGVKDALDDIIGDDPGWVDPQSVPSVQNGCTNTNGYSAGYGAATQILLNASGSGEFVGGKSVVGFNLWTLKAEMWADYDVQRSRKETVEFTISADVQPVLSPRIKATTPPKNKDEIIEVTLSSSQVDQPVDPDGAIPIGDVRRNSYMKTDRGHQTLEYLITYCRARLLSRARCMRVSFECPFALVADLTLRQSVSITDPRLPGGGAFGKVTGLELSLSGDDGSPKAKVTMACTIGRGQSLTTVAGALLTGTETYATGYTVPGTYSVATGGATDLASGDIRYADYGDTVLADDGVNFFNILASQVIMSLVVLNGCRKQEYLLTNVVYDDTNSAIATLNDNCTKVALALRPLTTSDAFESQFNITVSDLMVPKTIDLEAASVGSA